MRTIAIGIGLAMTLACADVPDEPGSEVDDAALNQRLAETSPRRILRRPLEQCGSAICAPGTYCCNASCNLCAPRGMACTQQVCEEPELIPCGPNFCAVGEVCCNPSCGICTPPDGACTLQYCGPVVGPPCGEFNCEPGEFCCNESCGICAPMGGACTQQFCE